MAALTADEVGHWLSDIDASAADLARWTGLDHSTLSKFLGGDRFRLGPKSEEIVRVAMRAHPAQAKAARSAVSVPATEADPVKSALSGQVGAALSTLVELSSEARSESVRLQAALAILHFAHGKPSQHVTKGGGKPPATDAELLAVLQRIEKGNGKPG